MIAIRPRYLQNLPSDLLQFLFLELPSMMKEDKTQDLSSVYALLGRISALPILRTTFLEYIKVGRMIQIYNPFYSHFYS